MSRDEQMISEFVGGTPVSQIAARYGVAEEYVDRVIEEAAAEKPKRRWDWGIGPVGNRIMYAVVTGIVVQALTANVPAFLVVVFLTFCALTFINAMTG